MSEQIVESLKRGAIEGVIAAGGAFFAAMQLPDATYERALLMAGGAFFAALALRWGEGLYDARRAARVAAGTEAPIPADVR